MYLEVSATKLKLMVMLLEMLNDISHLSDQVPI